MNDSNQKATKIEYTLNNGSTWKTASTTEATSGSFTISGLTEGTNYSVKVRTTRKANSITYITSALPIKTWYYPYATTSPNFTVGNSLTIALTNEKPKSVKVYLKIGNNTSTLYETTSTTSVTGFNSAAWKTWLYSQLPTKNPTAYQVVVVETASSTTRTRNAGNTVIINETECKPVYDTSNGFDYTDINTNVTALTGNNQIIVKGYSDIAATVSTAQKATAPSGTSSSIVDYTLKIGNQTARNDYSSDSAVRIPATGSIQGVNPDIVSGQGTISVIATDSRGLTTTSSKTATVKEYTQPVISNITATRSLNGAGEEVTLSLNGTYWKDSFGTSNNTIVSVIYKFRKSTTQTWTTGTTTITPTLSGDNNTFKVENLPIRGDTSEGEWTANDTYILRIEVKDTLLNAVSSNVAGEYTIVAGTPAIAIYKSNVSIGNKYDTSLGDKLQINGTAHANQFKNTGGSSWIKSRDTATARNTNTDVNSYRPVTSSKTTNGEWSIGIATSGEELCFQYTTDTDYNNNNNTASRWHINTSGQYSGKAATAGTADNATSAGKATLSNKLENINGRITNANIAHTYENNKSHLQLLLATASMKSNKPASDGYILHCSWDNSGQYVGQLYLPNSNGNTPLQFRGCNNGTWGSWENLYRCKNLYNNTSGTTGTVTLSETAANFTYIEVFCLDSYNRMLSQKIFSPNGKVAYLSSFAVFGTSSTAIGQTSCRKFNGTAFNIDGETGGWNGWNNSYTKNNTIKVVRIDGYR